MDETTRYEAVSSRDARFDGEFFFAVETTGIYCRPSCPAVTPKRRNVRFYPTAAAAQSHGFRACRRCRPDAVPGSAEWNVRADVVGRAMRMIGDGVVDREGVPGLAHRLGYSPRQVQRQLNAELGAGPVALARAQRAHTARVLLQTTALPVTEIAFAAGFHSIRQFNDTVRRIYARTPSALRAEAGTGLGTPVRASRTTGIPLRLAHRGPYAARDVFDLLAAGTVARVEEVTGEPGRRTHRRTLRLPYGTGVAAVDERSAGNWLDARIHLTDLRDLTTAVQRLRRLFDLDADPYAVDELLAADPALAPDVAARPGVRSPGTADAEEFAVRALVGDAAAGELVEAYGKVLDLPHGGLTHLFPEPAVLAEASADPALRALTAALADGTVRLDAGADRDEAEQALLRLPGITPATAALIRMRGLGDPDVDPYGLRGASRWRPWRSYGVRRTRPADAQPQTSAPSQAPATSRQANSSTSTE
ncbi:MULTISPECIES: DNA-3-methyladenine glycosylase 2 family protein [unclassified Streptomyces]|uniref:DNA-3-methyladenine glycosylase 2 family protein n=1 Tax=unclassified Streptomyces TaxID=2593676 RepID=UPI000DAB991C|nr:MULTISPECIES: DNA-3-methyladenine glycosylase 2 family protein [unclassified Streptomyces]PZT77427.1 DNA-3-methyladenine glycosylase 2 family protein [Streptomyces sp. AC1-42W]PZT78618.1 DNA-3-methyladenine glycosylase 2 family protein [Streptomyces sp. AC1-42T]